MNNKNSRVLLEEAMETSGYRTKQHLSGVRAESAYKLYTEQFNPDRRSLMKLQNGKNMHRSPMTKGLDDVLLEGTGDSERAIIPEIKDIGGKFGDDQLTKNGILDRLEALKKRAEINDATPDELADIEKTIDLVHHDKFKIEIYIYGSNSADALDISPSSMSQINTYASTAPDTEIIGIVGGEWDI